MKLREVDWLALVTGVMCLALGVVSYNALNPDGVSYLDLATRLGVGDWSHFVQGYWSPLYPALVAFGGALSGRAGPELIGVVHVVNTLIALCGVSVIWWMARTSGSAIFARGAFAAFLVSSAEAPRLEAVTPDLLLVAFVSLIGGELLFFGGRRPVRLGLWMGLAFLAKTSMWPWLLASLVTWAIFHRSRAGLLLVGKAATVCAVVMSLWLVPLSLKSGAFTFGSAARLNACWYIRECDSRSPDTHRAEHKAYRPFDAGSSKGTIALYSGTPWTYLPWSDPTAWAAGLITANRGTPTVWQNVVYTAKQFALVVGVWMPHIWLGILIPVAWLMRRRGMVRELLREQRDALLVVALAVLGLLQFIAVHVEPRLIAPFALLLTLGALGWLCGVSVGADHPTAEPKGSPRMVWLLSGIGLLAALPRAAVHAAGQWDTARQVAARTAMIQNSDANAQSLRRGARRIAVIGEVFPLLTEAYRLGGQIEWQVFQPSATTILTWPAEDQQALVRWLASQGATEAWLSKPGGTFSLLPLPPP
ncbi:MAG: hypothetical protein ABJC19_01495 [Gemmatimonadota bacterium]